MNTNNRSNKEDIKTCEVKREISVLTKQALINFKITQILKKEYELLLENDDLLREHIKKYSTSKPGITIESILSDLNNIYDKLNKTNTGLKLENQSKQSNLIVLTNEITEEINSVKQILDPAREESFFLENKLLLKEFKIERIKKTIREINMVQELERDEYISEEDRRNVLLTIENLKFQEHLLKKSKNYNLETIRKEKLGNRCLNLKKKIMSESQIFKNNNNILNGNAPMMNHNLFNQQQQEGEEDHLKNSQSHNFNQYSIENQIHNLENLSFDGFKDPSIQNSFEYDDLPLLLFPNIIQIINLPEEKSSNIKVNSQQSIQHYNHIIPKLDLKQIEFNKSKVNNELLFDICENNNNRIKGNNNINLKQFINCDQKGDCKDNIDINQNKNGFQIDGELNTDKQIKNDIDSLESISAYNRKLIQDYKKFHKDMCSQYNCLEMKYLNEREIENE